MAVAAGVAAAAVALPAPVQAHAGLVLTVNDEGRGNVSVDVAWADGHPVTETIAGTLMATGAAQVGPSPLTRLPGGSTLVHPRPLPPGTWQVTVDVALPAIGRCAAPVTVGGAAAKPGTTRCAPSADPVATPPSPDPFPWVPVVAGASAVLAALILLIRARRRAGSAARPRARTVQRRPPGAWSRRSSPR
jgi:hypothetical protein